MKRPPPIQGRPWTDEDDNKLRIYCDLNLSQRRIGQLLDRRASSVGCRMRILRIPSNRRRAALPDLPTTPEWPADMHFEDDPRACRREAPWRGEPVAARSAQGCATALLEMA